MNLKKIGKVFTSKFVGTGPSSYKKRIYRAAISQRLRKTVLDHWNNGSQPVSHGPQVWAVDVTPNRPPVSTIYHTTICQMLVFIVVMNEM